MEYNICKFNPNASSDLICSNFVYEAKQAQSGAQVCDHHLLGLVTTGEGLLCKAPCAIPLQAGSLFLIEQGEHFSITGRSELKYIYICFSGRRAEELLQRIGPYAAHCVFEGYTQLCPFWMDALQRADSGNIDLLAEAVVLYTFSQLKPCAGKQNDLMTAIITLTNKHFTEADFSLSSLAERLRYDAKYLSALFKKRKGMPYTAYLRDLRIRHAIFLMERGVVSVKNIALLSGFGDALYFSRVFKESEGISPKAYLSRLQESRS